MKIRNHWAVNIRQRHDNKIFVRLSMSHVKDDCYDEPIEIREQVFDKMQDALSWVRIHIK